MPDDKDITIKTPKNALNRALRGVVARDKQIADIAKEVMAERGVVNPDETEGLNHPQNEPPSESET